MFKSPRLIFTVFSFFLIAAFSLFQNSERERYSDHTLVPVIKVIDGDTIVVNLEGQKEKVRMIGINTPESVAPHRPVECFGQEASEKAKTMLNGQNVKLEADPSQGDRDRYGRLLRYVFLEDGTPFNQLMIEQGYAFEYTYNKPYQYQAGFQQAQNEAQLAKIGLWSEKNCSY